MAPLTPLIPILPSVARHVDLKFRSALILSQLFTKSWGHPDVIKQMAKYRREVMSKRLVMDYVKELNPQIDLVKKVSKNGVTSYEGFFTSPHAVLFPDHMPGKVARAHFRAYLPDTHGPVCIHLAGTGDHSYFRRQYFLVDEMLKDGVGSILIQNPFYGDRKPPNQFRSSLQNVTDLFVMGAALIAECNHLFNWAESLGYGPFAISGVSMGGFMAQLAGTNSQRPVGIVPILAWTTASPSYTEGAISPAVNYPLLQKQLEDAHYTDKIRKIPDQNWLDRMHEMTAKNGETEARNMMRILMDDFTSLEFYPTPLDTSLCHVFLADQDQYVLRGQGTPTYEQLWPNVTVEMMSGQGHVTSYFLKHNLWRKRIMELLKRQQQKDQKKN
uniref:AB hydrolase-1 domain-containing protein n=1 Tax=Caenorhabditis tropicalis TaxID=1561998 RepID=A0A1I7UC15_9PELO